MNEEFLKRCSLKAQLTIIITAYLDDEEEEFFGEMEFVWGNMKSVLSGETEHFSNNDWWTFYDALGVFGGIDFSTELMEIYALAKLRKAGKLPKGRTKCFCRDLVQQPPFSPDHN